MKAQQVEQVPQAMIDLLGHNSINHYGLLTFKNSIPRQIFEQVNPICAVCFLIKKKRFLSSYQPFD
jgi:hypothetical protein